MTIQQYVFKRGKNLVGIGKFQLVLKYHIMQENLSKWRGSKIDKGSMKPIGIYDLYNKVLLSLL